MKIYLLLLLLVILPSVLGVLLEEGVQLNPSGINMTVTAGKNHTLDNFTVFSDGFSMNDNRFNFSLPTGTVNITEFNYSLGYTTMLMTGIYPVNVSTSEVDFELTNFLDSTTVSNDDNLVEYDSDGIFSTNITNTSSLITLDSDDYYVALSFENITSGIVSDEDKSINFTNDNYLLLLNDFSTGYVNILFNMIDGENWTQYYSFDNTQDFTYSDDLYLLKQADTLMYFRALDIGNSPLKDVTVRVYHVYPNSTWSDYTLIGQRLTNHEGYTFFFLDSDTQILVTFSKDDYELNSYLISPADETRNTEATAFTTNLEYDTDSNDLGVWYRVSTMGFDVEDVNLTHVFYAPGKEVLTWNTSTGLFGTVYPDNYDRFKLEYPNPGYNDTSVTSFSLDIDFDELHFQTFDIFNHNLTQYDLIDKDDYSGLTGTYLNPILFILVIVLSSMTTIVMNNSHLGYHTFMITSILMGLVSSAFLWLSAVCLLHYVARFARGFVEK